MAPTSRSNQEQPIGDVLRARRIDELHKGLREMAKILDIAPAHLTDLEKGRRTPSEGLLLRIAKAYGVSEAELRAGWSRAEGIVSEVATQDSLTAEKVPEFLRTARKLSQSQWDKLIAEAKKMGAAKKRKKE
ncbi:MAG: helix-turn-helix domain-containing protein [Dehalococcoidia bacterium]